MPTCSPTKLTAVANQFVALQPTSVLDLGVGFGKWGLLAREYCDVWCRRYFHKAIADEAIVASARWAARIVGVEICSWYRTPVHDFVYDSVHWGVDVCDTAVYLTEPFDLILCLDVIEHLPKDAGRQLLATLYQHATQAVIVAHPWPGPDALKQGPYACGVYCNERERHLAIWEDADFVAYPYRLSLVPQIVTILPKSAAIQARVALG